MAGTGTYVKNTETSDRPMAAHKAVGFVGGENILLNKYDQAFDLVGDMYEDVVSALGTLETLSSTNLPDGWERTLRNVVIDDVVNITRDGIPEAPTIELPDDWPTDIPILGALKAVPDVDLNYSEPTLPDDVDPTVTWTPSSYISGMYDTVFNAIYDGIENGGPAFSDDVQDAIMARGRDRQRVTNAREYSRAMKAVSADGFDFPTGAQASVLLESIAELAQQDENLNNDIIKIVADLTQQNSQFMIDKGLAIEDILRKFHIETERLSLESQLEIAKFVLMKYSEKIKAYIASWEGIKVELEAKIQSVDVVLKQNDVIFKTFDAQMGGYSATVDLMAKKIAAIVEGYKGEITGFQAIVESNAAWWRALTDEQKAKLQKNQLELTKAVEEIKALVDSTVSLSGLKEKIATSLANITAQVLASALSSVSASISHGTSIKESLSESFGHDDSISESHKFDETPT